jgi:hypothetical protein
MRLVIGKAPDRTAGDKKRQFKMENALLVAMALRWGQFGNPGKRTSAFGGRYQRIGVRQ